MNIEDVSTYRDLLDYLDYRHHDLEQDITILDKNGEYSQARLMVSGKDCDVLDEGHLFLTAR